MKLLMISGDRSLAGGKHGAFYNTLEEFHKYWDRIDIICPKTPRGSTSGVFEVEPLFGNVFIHSSPRSIWLQPWWILREGLRIIKNGNWKMVNGKWDGLMTVHEYPPFYNGIGARLLWSKIRVPYVLEIHHIPGHPKAADFKERLYKIATRLFVKYDAAKAKAVRVVNQHQVPEFLIRAGVPKEKIVYIPSFYIDLDIFKSADIEKKYDLIFIGRLAKNKGIKLLLQAMSNIKTQMPNVILIIVGVGPLSQDLKLKTRNHKLETNVIFHGWAKNPREIAELLNQSKILVMPSYNEGGPRVVLEAMACGLPVIATKVGLMLDVIRDGDSGLITDWTPSDLDGKIIFLLKNQELQKKLSQLGLNLVKEFEKKSTIKNYAEKLQKIILDHRKTGGLVITAH